ncbi:MAG: ROK family protein [Phycisphaerae bacterium]|jgi:glucokinase
MPAVLHGLDIGGTKIGVCIGDADGCVLASRRFATDHATDPAEILDRALGELEQLSAQLGTGSAAALGVACPGPYHAGRQRFLDPPNMPRWHGFALGEFLRARVAGPAAAMNDANAAVLAEWYWGAGVGFRNVVYFTMSTGMGAGFILDGRLYQGTDGFAAEIGHLPLEADGPVGFGRRGSVEGYLSGPGIVQVAEAERRVCRQTGEATALDAVADGLSAANVCAAASAGDPAARRAIDRCAMQLGRLMAILTDVLNPELFVLGTIGSAYPELFIPRATVVLHEQAIRHSAEIVRVVPSGLTDPGSQQALAVARGIAASA